jgi:hypothetical protein
LGAYYKQIFEKIARDMTLNVNYVKMIARGCLEIVSVQHKKPLARARWATVLPGANN